MELVTALLGAVAIDTCLGEPKRYHPLVGFGVFANKVETVFYSPHASTPARQIGCGCLALMFTVVPPVIVAVGLQWFTNGITHWLIGPLILYLAIGHASLRRHARAVSDALATGDMPASRKAVSYLVSRNTDNLDEQAISAATIESVLENGNDALFAAVFWFVIAGIPGVVAYRLVNTLDAMWGYKNARYLYFGRAAAKLDDALNWLPARLTAISYALIGNTGNALRCWQAQGRAWKSPNAGTVMATGAGALSLRLGGAAYYHGEQQLRPQLGCDRLPVVTDIHRALRLVLQALLLWLAIITVTCLFVIYT